MEDRDFTLPSGASLKVGMAPFVDAKRLHDRLLQALVGKGIGGLDLKDLQARGAMGAAAMDAVMQVASNPEVEAAMFECAKRALYSHDGQESSRLKVDRTLFDDPKAGERAREDFYLICLRIMEVNLAPFLKAIISALGAQAATIAGIQKSISGQTKPLQ